MTAEWPVRSRWWAVRGVAGSRARALSRERPWGKPLAAEPLRQPAAHCSTAIITIQRPRAARPVSAMHLLCVRRAGARIERECVRQQAVCSVLCGPSCELELCARARACAVWWNMIIGAENHHPPSHARSRIAQREGEARRVRPQFELACKRAFGIAKACESANLAKSAPAEQTPAPSLCFFS